MVTYKISPSSPMPNDNAAITDITGTKRDSYTEDADASLPSKADIEMTIEDCDKIALKRDIGLFSAMGIIIGIIIGSGIFMAPVAIVRQCNSVGLSLVVWVVSGLVSIMKSMCFIELGLLFPRAGGEYAYMREINGETLAFLNAYVSMFASRPAGLAMLSKITVDYFTDAFLPGCRYNPMFNNILAAWLLLSIVAMNSLAVKKIMIIQNVFAMMKLGALALIIITGSIHIFSGNTENFQEPFKDSNYSITNIAVAIYAGIYSYDGWQGIYDLMEDIKKPEKIAPRASTMSILLIIVLYVGTNIAYFSTMSPAEMTGSTAVAMSFARVTMGPFSRIIPLLVGCSTIGALNAAIMTGSRNLFAQGRDGVFPTALCMLSIKNKVPWIASWLICMMSCLYIFAYNIFELFDYMNFTGFIFSIILYGNVIILRYTRPDLHRPYKVNLLVPAFVVTLVLVMAVSGAVKSPYNFMVAQFLVLAGLPLFAFVKYCNTHPTFIYAFKYKFNSFLQKLLLIVPPET